MRAVFPTRFIVKYRWPAGVIALLLVGCLGVWLIAAVQQARTAARRTADL